MSDNEERKKYFEERLNDFMMGLAALSSKTGMHICATNDEFYDFEVVLTGSEKQAEYLFGSDGVARTLLSESENKTKMFYSYCSGCGENCLLDAPPLKPMEIRNPIEAYFCEECKAKKSIGDKSVTQRDNDILNDELFALTGEEQIVSLLKKVIKNQERDNERQDRRDSAFGGILEEVLKIPENLKELKR